MALRASIGAVAVGMLVTAGIAQAQLRSLPGAKPTSGAPSAAPLTCGTPNLPPEAQALVSNLLRDAPKVFIDGEMHVPVAVHLITSGKKGKYSRAVVNLLINNLNAGFYGTGFSFYLAKLDYRNNPKWYAGCAPLSANEAAMKKKLAYQPAKVLNIYSCIPAGPGLPPGLIGYAWFPWMLPEASKLQGVVIHPGTLPSGAGIPNYDYYGLNAVHETGHWLGLYHTFHPGSVGSPSGCTEPGDEVADTPVQDLPTGVCEQVDTCPQAGLDDVSNFMNYVDDHCYNHFTPEQAARMRAATIAFRPSLF